MSGCVSDGGIKPLVAPIDPQPADFSHLSHGRGGDVNWPRLNWIAQFQDPQLEQLVAEAIAQNPDMQSAQARVRAALAKSEELGSARGFSGELGAQISRTRLPDALEPFNANVANTNLPVEVSFNPWITPTGLVASASYEFDVWGKKSALLRALQSNQFATGIDVQQVRLTLTTTLVSACNRHLVSQYSRTLDASDEVNRAVAPLPGPDGKPGPLRPDVFLNKVVYEYTLKSVTSSLK